MPRRREASTIRLLAAALILLVMNGAMAERAGAQRSQRRRISLAQAMALAMRNNRVLKAAELESEAGSLRADTARGALLPRLDATENFSNTDSPPLVFSNLLSQEDFTQSDFALDKLNHPSPFSNFQSQVRLSQPLFAGGRLFAAFRAARFGAAAERWRAIRARQQVRYAVVQSYHRAVLAEQRLGVIERALAAARAHLTRARNLERQGMVVKADVLRTNVRVGSLEEKQLSAQSGLRIAWASLAHTLGDEDERLAPLKEPPQLSAPPPAARQRLEALIAEARGARPEVKIAQERVAQAKEAVTIARAGYLPSVSVNATYENDTQHFSRAGNSYSVFVAGRLNLFNGLATRASVDAASAELDRTKELREDLLHAVALEVESTYRTLTSARKSLVVARGNDTYAGEALKILEDRYGSGLATNVEVLDAETNREEAAMQLAEAKVAVLLDAAALELAVGRPPAE
jgi:outer membrane protein